MASLVFRRPSLSGSVVAAVAVVASSWLALRTVATLGRPGEASAAAPARVVAPEAAPAVAAWQPPDGAGLIARNMFCAHCTSGPAPGPGAAPRGQRFTARLIATSVEGPGRGAATLDDPATGRAGRFTVGAVAPGGAVVVAVRREAIDVRFSDATIETIALAGTGAGSGPGAGAAPDGGARSADPWGGRIRAVADDRWEVERSLIGELVGGGTATAVPGVRLIPISTGGKVAGVKVAAARAGSLARALGLESGDVIEGVGGRPLDASALMEMYGQLDRLTSVELAVRRKGVAQTLRYDLR